MVFSSFTFLFRFLPIVLICYFAAPGKLKNLVLFLSSLVFYAWGEPIYVLLMLFSTLVDYVNGLGVAHFKSQNKLCIARCFLVSSIVINLCLLGTFKYLDFLILSLNQVFPIHLTAPGLALPIGISFYTFQTMSYTIDVYRGEAKVQHNIISFGTYVAMFPQLIAGPIVRYQTIDDELRHRTISLEGFANGCWRFTIGLGKKVLLANSIGAVCNQIFNLSSGNLPFATSWLGILLFMFQIYFDFSGYSDMAIGLGLLFGFHFPENFRYPYEAKSITEFWQKWHISLSTWFREYVYIPLGGNRAGKGKQIRNLLIVWALTGIWHGASWNFLYWGLYFALLLILEKMVLSSYLSKLPEWIQHLYALVFILIGWGIFVYPDLAAGSNYYLSMLGLGADGFANVHTLSLIGNQMVLLIVAVIGCTRLPISFGHKIKQKSSSLYQLGKTLCMVCILLLCIASLVNDSYNPFLYFRF